jgi:hypothetical protein
MDKDNATDTALAMGSRDVLTEILRTGARQMLIDMIKEEVNAYLAQSANERDEQGHRRVVRNGVRKGRTIQTGLGTFKSICRGWMIGGSMSTASGSDLRV